MIDGSSSNPLTATLTSMTFSGNVMKGCVNALGGAIYQGSSSTIYLVSSTIATMLGKSVPR